MTQKDALNILKAGQNVFITGPAGSGKTFVVNQYIRYLKDHEVPIGITASTGIAATHMGGVTIHSWSGIGIKDYLSEDDVEAISQRASVRKKIEDAQVLIIDEVSMLHHFRLDLVDQVLKHIKKSQESFGGIQIVLCGDFFQLPPVSRMGEQQPRFMYHADSWKQGKFAICYLSENYRQGDDIALTILNEIRSGEVSVKSKELLQGRFKRNNPPPLRGTPFKKGESEVEISVENSDAEIPLFKGGADQREVGDYSEDTEEVIDLNAQETLIEPTRLYTHNIDVDIVNDRELGKVKSNETLYEMISRGRKPLVDTLKKSCLAPEKLRLKKGARVMCVKNNFEKGYVNGTLGVVISCGYGVDPVIRAAATPDYPDGRLLTIEPATWQIEDDGKVLAELQQYPLRLAWAITVHKSQGMSLDAIEVDLSRSFEPGMGYVALSRVRTLAGLRILGLNEHALKVHHEVLEYDRHLRELSAKAESVISHTDEKEIIRAQEEFLGKVAPMHSYVDSSGKTVTTRVKKAKPAKISTFGKTMKLIHDKKNLKEMATERDMGVETIISHVEYLISTDESNKEEHITQADIAYLKYEISPQHFGKIEKALEEVSLAQDDDKAPLLSPVKNKVGASISFKDIRLARVLLGYFKKNTQKKGNDTEAY